MWISSRLRQKKFTKIGWNCWISARRTSLRSSWRTSTTRSTASSWTVIAAKIGITWKLIRKVEFHHRHHCKTKISRGSGPYFGTFWPNTGFAKWNKLFEWFKRVSGCWINSQWKFPRYQSTSVIPTSSNSWRNAKPFFWSAEPQRRAAKHLWHTWYIGNVFVNPDASSSAPYPQELNQWSSLIEEPVHSSTVEKSERRTQDQDHRCQSGPSAKNSVIFSGGDSPKNYGADQQRLQISDLHLDKFPAPATFACWKIRFKTEVCTCSQFPTEAMLWIKEVEMVDSVDELRSSSSIRGISMPNFGMLDARIGSALNKIIHNFHFRRRISLEEQQAQKQDRFLRGRQIAYLIYDYFRVIGSHDSVENYTDLFNIVLRSDDIQEFDSKWDGISWSMTKIPRDDILEGLSK